MVIFKRSSFTYVQNLGLAVISWPCLYLALNTFSNIQALLLSAPSIVTLFLMYLAVFADNIRFEVDGSALKYYRTGRLQREIELSEYGLAIRESRGRSSCLRLELCFERKDGTGSFSVDATMLGEERFLALCDVLKELCVQ